MTHEAGGRNVAIECRARSPLHRTEVTTFSQASALAKWQMGGAFEPGDFTATGQLKLRPARQAAFATVPCGSRMNFTGAPLSKSA